MEEQSQVNLQETEQEQPKEQNFKIKYIPTGNIFELPKSECDRLVTEEANNFEVVDEGYTAPKPEPTESSIQSQVIIDDEPTAEGQDEDESHDDADEVNPYKTLPNKDAVIAVLKERNIEFSASAKRAELEALLVANDKATAEGQ